MSPRYFTFSTPAFFTTGQQFPEITGLFAWFVVKFPNFLVEGALKEQLRGLFLNPDSYELVLAAIDRLPQGSTD